MASGITRMSKWLFITGGALVVAGLILALAVGTSSPGGVSAQTTPVRTATPAAPGAVATPVRTASPAAAAPAAATPVRTASPAAASPPAATPARTATAAVVVATPTRVATAAPVAPAPAAPSALPANGDSVTFPALAIALAGAGLVGFGLFARYSMGKSKA